MAELIGRGFGIGHGMVTGPVARAVERPSTLDYQPESPEVELEHAMRALARVSVELTDWADQVRAESATWEERGDGNRAGDVSAAEILMAQAMMADDPALAERVTELVKAGAPAPDAIAQAFDGYVAKLANASSYLSGRVADVQDVCRRAVAMCQGVPSSLLPDYREPFILVARELSPADIAELDDMVLAIVTAEGGPTSHTAIVARARGLLAVMGCPDAADLNTGRMITLDTRSGEIYGGKIRRASVDLIIPGGIVLRHSSRVDRPDASFPPRWEKPRTPRVRVPDLSLPEEPEEVRPGGVRLLANIGVHGDLRAAQEARAEGVGLLRTEFLFPDTAEAPGFEEQVRGYQRVLEAFADVTIRVLDVGADKARRYLPLPVEANPALGVRGLRALRVRPELLETQLTAIATASGGRRVRVMAPMVSDVDDAQWFAQQARRLGLSPGVMIEVPSAALMAEELLAEVDFASIGTNDLVQYTFAADRQSGRLAGWQDPWHPAVLRLVDLVGQAGERLGKPIGVCGEAAADPELANVLCGLGVTGLSMNPLALQQVRARLRLIEDCRQMAQRALRARTAHEARILAAQPTGPV